MLIVMIAMIVKDSMDKNFKIHSPIWAPTKTFWILTFLTFLGFLGILAITEFFSLSFNGFNRFISNVPLV